MKESMRQVDLYEPTNQKPEFWPVAIFLTDALLLLLTLDGGIRRLVKQKCIDIGVNILLTFCHRALKCSLLLKDNKQNHNFLFSIFCQLF